LVEIIIPVGVCDTIQVLDLSKTIDQHFPALGSNCALKASTFINTLVLSQHEGGECLDDVVVGVCAFFWFLFLDWGKKSLSYW
jgi:hypothetical protein